MNITNVKYAAGMVTILNVLDAHNEVAIARIDRLRAHFQVLQSYLALREAIGEQP